MKYASYRQDAALADVRRGQNGDLGDRQYRFGDQYLIIADDIEWDSVAERARDIGVGLTDPKSLPDDSKVYLVRQKGRLFEKAFPAAQIVHNGGRFLAVSLSEQEYERVSQHDSICFEISPMPDSGVVFERRVHRSARREASAWVRALVDMVSADEYQAVLERLVSFPTRHSMSEHYHSAVKLCKELLSNLGYETRLQEVPIGSQVASNVIAEKSGGLSERKLVIAMAHLDSINIQGNSDSTAPGADDNGSGSAAIIEIARVLQDHVPEHDLQLILLGGEELGLFGSKHYVSVLDDADKARLLAAVNMDMIASSNLNPPTVLIEAGDQAILDELATAADMFTTLHVETSLNPFASDHVPFIDAGLPAALTIEGADSQNDNIHTEHDTLVHINAGLAREIIRMNVGFITGKLGKAH